MYLVTCIRLRLQYFGLGAKHPEWMGVSNSPDDVISSFLTLVQESDSVRVLREKIKTFLTSQGMIKGHSGPGPAILTSNCKY